MYATPANNYWVVADQPSNLRWSSATPAYVGDTDATYLAWLAEGYETSYIDSEQELADLLNETYPAGSPIPAPPASTAALGPMTVDLVLATTLLAALGDAIGGIEAIELIEGGNEAVTLPDEPGIGLLAAGADTTGTYTVPAGVYKLIIFGQAGGGAGGSCTAAGAQVGGGGGPGETRCMVLAVQPGQVLNYTIGGRGLASGGTANDTTVGGVPSPAPTVLGRTQYFDGTAPVSQSYSLPAGIVAGDLLIALVHTQSGNAHTVTTPAGWTLLNDTVGGTHHTCAYYKIAAGGETSFTIVTSHAGGSFRIVFSYRITGHDPATAPLVGGAQSTSTSANPPPVNAAAWGAVNKLWIAWAASGHDVTGTPSGFTNGIGGPTSGNAFWGRSAEQQSNATSNDPSTYTAQNELWGAQTIAIKSAPPVTSMTCKGGLGGGNAAGGNNGAGGGDAPTGSGGIRIPSPAGSIGISQAGMCWSRGGCSFFGQGAENVRLTTMGGLAGFGPGGGGSGGGNGSGGTAQSGGDGAPGLLLIFGFGK
jgi:hypothetical protein